MTDGASPVELRAQLEVPHLRVASGPAGAPDAKLHAKAVIVNSRDVLLTSANMTSAAYDRNTELGVLCHGGGVAAQVVRAEYAGER